MSMATVAGYTGQYRDQVAWSHPLGNGYRHYLPGLMRFAAPDRISPFGSGGPNPYVYCACDPMNRYDPSGHISVWAVVADVIVDTAIAADIGVSVLTGDPIGAVLGGVALATTIASQVVEQQGNRTLAIWLGMASMLVSVPTMIRAGTQVAKLASMASEVSTESATARETSMIAEEGESLAERPPGGEADGPEEGSNAASRRTSVSGKSDITSPVTAGAGADPVPLVSRPTGTVRLRLAQGLSLGAVGGNIAGGIFTSIDALTEKPPTIAARSLDRSYGNGGAARSNNPYRPTPFSNPYSPSTYSPYAPYGFYFNSPLAAGA
jgi:RHS repeat-associated protein